MAGGRSGHRSIARDRATRTRTPLLVPPGVASCVMYIYACLLCLSTYACMHAAFCFHVSCLNLASELANGLVVRWSIGAGGPPERLNRRNLGGAGERACSSALVSWRRPLGVPCAGAGGGLAMKCNAFGACVLLVYLDRVYFWHDRGYWVKLWGDWSIYGVYVVQSPCRQAS